MDGQTLGVVIGLSGGVLGVAGGIMGTYYSVRSAGTPALRRLMGRAAVWLWLGAVAMVAAQFVLPVPWRWWVWLPYAVVLSVGIWRLNNKYRALLRS